MEFTVTLNVSPAAEVTVGYRTVDGTAQAGLDYTPTTNGGAAFRGERDVEDDPRSGGE